MEGGRNRQNTENLQGRKTSLYDTERVVYILVKTHKLYNTKSEA